MQNNLSNNIEMFKTVEVQNNFEIAIQIMRVLQISLIIIATIFLIKTIKSIINKDKKSIIVISTILTIVTFIIILFCEMVISVNTPVANIVAN